MQSEGGLTTEDPSPENIARGVNEVAPEKISGSVGHSSSTSDYSTGTSRSKRAYDLPLWKRNPLSPFLASDSVVGNLIVLGEEELDDFEAEADYGNHRGESAEPDAGLVGSTKAAFNSRTLVPPSSPQGCHDTEPHDFNKTAQRLLLAEQEASASDSIRRYNPSSRGSSEPLHNGIGTDGLYRGRARSEAATSHFAPSHSQPPRCSRASLLNQLSQEDHLYTSKSTPYEHELVSHGLDTDTFDDENEQEQDDGEEHWDDDDGGQTQQGVNNAAAALTGKSGSDIRLSSHEGKSAKPPKRQLLSSRPRSVSRVRSKQEG